jgi:hypothetical protein
VKINFSNDIKRVFEAYQRQLRNISRTERELAEDIHLVSRAIDVLHQINSHHIVALILLKEDYQNKIRGLAALMEGRLTTDLVDLISLHKAIKRVKKTLKDNYSNFYLAHLNITITPELMV